jgi:hypothetical protein
VEHEREQSEKESGKVKENRAKKRVRKWKKTERKRQWESEREQSEKESGKVKENRANVKKWKRKRAIEGEWERKREWET